MNKQLDCRPEGVEFHEYLAKAHTIGLAPMSEELWKALPIAGSDSKKGCGDKKMAMKADDAEDDVEDDAEDDNEDTGGDDADVIGDDDGDEEEDGGMVKTKKSMVSASDLLKSIEAYESVEGALEGAGTSRETFLMARLDSGPMTKSGGLGL